MPVNWATVLGCGIFGSVVVELLYALRIYQAGHPFPQRYSRVGFWIVRTLIAFAAGILALIYDPHNLFLALQIGASTPLIITTLTDSLPPDIRQKKE